MTRILTRGDLLGLLDPHACIDALGRGFREADGVTTGPQRVRAELPFAGTATALIPGLLPGIEAYTVKVNAKFPGASPALRGVICLFGSEGELLGLIDSATITAWRTGLAAAVGTNLLAKTDAPVVAVIGAGAQAELMLLGLSTLRNYSELVVHDVDGGRATAFAKRHGGRTAMSCRDAAAEADIVLLATWSQQPLLDLDDSRPGQHLTSLGVDELGKRELTTDLLDASLLVVDDRRLAREMGVLTEPGLRAQATLGELLRGEHPGRTSDDQRTIYAPVGLPWQDLALSWLAYREAERRDRGRTVDLLA